MGYAATARPLMYVDTSERVDYLKGVALLTGLGLTVSAITGVLSALLLAPLVTGRWSSMIIILGSYGIAHYVAPRFVFGEQKWLGFMMGAVFQGVAMGYLLLVAFLVSMGSFGNGFLLIGQALGLTALTTVGMGMYLWSGPKELSLVKAGLSAAFLPMLLLMGISFVFPIGGWIGVGISALFVVVSAAGLMYQMNVVLHELRTDMRIEGAYMITMGVLVLFWNVLTLLLRLTSRD
ncbi:MAG: Bax inhibitor-1 family protein [Alphaproteobacteria bacterium]|nr:Bax inhibitor-1 family protein [Alphaproteobacteria bacterium]